MIELGYELISASGNKVGDNSMNQQRTDSLERRLIRLERQNRNLKHAVVLVVVGMAAVIMMGQAQPNKIAKKIEAENFILRDPNGAERGRLGVAPNGHPFFVLLNKSGKPSVSLGKLYGHASRRIKGNVITYGDGPSEGYYDKDGKPRTTVPYAEWVKERTTDVQKAGRPAESLVVLFDDAGNVFWSIP